MTSKKDYETIAALLAGELAVSTTEAERLRVRSITLSLADYFMRTNPRFVRTKFYDAVGIETLRQVWSE